MFSDVPIPPPMDTGTIPSPEMNASGRIIQGARFFVS
jgi:hypothetical protein